jgi:hypothetical protein
LLEQDVDHAVYSRYGRWWAAYGGTGSATLPFMMVGSGYQISNGYVDFYNTYKSMIEAEKARPPQADVTATYERIGNHFDVTVYVTNQSGTELSYSNQASVQVLVYEEARVNLTGRFVRAVSSTSISSLANGQTDSFNLTTDDISPANWNNVHVVALVDYYSDAIGHYDMLQAAIARETVPFKLSSHSVVFMFEPSETAVSPIALSLTGQPELTWQISGGANWFTAAPTQGNVTTFPQFSVVMGNIVDGWQEETVIVNAQDANQTYQEEVVVKAYRGALEKVYLPIAVSSP